MKILNWVGSIVGFGICIAFWVYLKSMLYYADSFGVYIAIVICGLAIHGGFAGILYNLLKGLGYINKRRK